MKIPCDKSGVRRKNINKGAKNHENKQGQKNCSGFGLYEVKRDARKRASQIHLQQKEIKTKKYFNKEI